MSKEVASYTPNETSKFMVDLIGKNDLLIARGELPIPLSILGEHGIGKSTICEEVAKNLGRDCFILNLSQITEMSELIGYYAKEFLLIDNDLSPVWVTENLIPTFVSQGYKYTGKVRTVSCPPDWVHNLKPRTILVLDDYSRGNSLVMQGIMEFIYKQRMAGWDLKGKEIQIVLNENPQDGDYNVAALDDAQMDRMARIKMVWCAKNWSERAERIGVDTRLINFTLWKPENFVNKKSEGMSSSGTASPRMMDNFYKLAGTFEDFEQNWDAILKFGNATVGSAITNDLLNFVKNNLDKLPTSHDLIKTMSLTEAKKKLVEVCGIQTKNSGKNAWQPATASVMATRLINFVRINAKTLTEADVIRYRELAMHESFGEDYKAIMIYNVLTDLGDIGSTVFFDHIDSDKIHEMFIGE